MSFNEIGYFQLENLIRNRIPFSLVMIGLDLVDHYGGMEKMHIQQHGIFLPDSDQETILDNFLLKKIPVSQALVLICRDGVKSDLLGKKLENQGYINSFVVAGGLNKILEEKKISQQ